MKTKYKLCALEIPQAENAVGLFRAQTRKCLSWHAELS